MPVTTIEPTGQRIVNPDGLIDLTAEEGAEATVTDAVVETAAVDPVTAPFVVGAFLGYEGEKALINNPTWKHHWEGVGAGLTDWLARAGIGIFGAPSDSVTHEELRLAENLTAHIILRIIRQFIGAINGQLKVQAGVTAKAVNKVAAHVRANKITAHSEALHVSAHADGLYAKALSYADGRAHQVGVAAEAYTDQQVTALQQWVISHVARPLNDSITNLQQLSDQQRQLIHTNGLHIDSIVEVLAPAVALLHQMEPQLAKVLTETEQCTEPMCEVVGPKTPWGQLLKKFAPAAIWALLTELAALHPDEVEKAAEGLAHALGPVLEKFAEAWIGALPGGTGPEVKEVESHVGTFNPLGIAGL